MIDIHSHILYGIDDGAKSFAESEALLRTAADNRVTAIITTPHLYSYDRVDEIAAMRDGIIAELKSEAESCLLKLYPGFEVFCGDGFDRIKDYSPFTLNKSRYILIEFEFYEESVLRVISFCDRLAECGLVPIIAHPERYGFFLEDYDAINSFANRNVLFQLNAGSLAGAFGSEERKLALALVDAGYCDFLATDAHALHGRSSNLLEMICAATELDITASELKRITDQNPRAIIENQPIDIRGRGIII